MARFLLSEKKLDYSCVQEVPWKVSDDLLLHNISGTLPVFIDTNNVVVFGSSAIREYIEEVYPDPNLIGDDYLLRAEVRRLCDWFDFIFLNDVYLPIINEKITKRFSKSVTKESDRLANPSAIRNAVAKLNFHMDYISWLIDRRNWLAGRIFSVADICAASFISVLDYIGSIQWNNYDIAKSWYVRIKSRPSFRGILNDNLSQIPPSKDYSNLDF
jgi:glutathione S-transferase